ncbi:hypothetical protein JXJ21_24810 [candidate division KSB1 bacterium]|nr:hypothetical protein [candidate division KSB1 bacterium]
MESIYHNFIGPFIFFPLIILILLAFILPKTKLSKHFKVTEKYFIITNIVGIICSVLGLIAIFTFSPDVVRTYLWKIIIIPYAYLQMYHIYVMVAKKTTQIYDEKQEFNTTTGAGLTLGATILIMGWIIIPLLKNNLLEIKLIFPLYINSVIFTFSLITLFLFKRA